MLATPVLADGNPIENMIVSLRAIGFNLVLLWLLTLAVVYGILSHLELPKSPTARGVISIVVSFLVLIAIAATQAATFLSNLFTGAIVVAFGLIVTMMFLEITRTKEGGEPIFAKHPKFFAAALIIIAILVFIGAGGLNFLTIPSIVFDNAIIGIGIFLIVMVTTVWILFKDNEK